MINDFEKEEHLLNYQYILSLSINTKAWSRGIYFLNVGSRSFHLIKSWSKSLTETIALQLAEKGIRVNAIAPGLIATDTINKELLGKEEKRKEKKKEIPFHRIGEPEEIAKIALFLASDDASYITGNMIYVDGGISLSRSNYFLESKLEQD
jgi:enoyl-[acyl-carrier-protein] reductase (NADH)